jgi:hypothetical protein
MVDDGYIKKLATVLDSATDSKLFETIVNAPFRDKIESTELDLGIIVLLLVEPKSKTIRRIALSNTAQARGAVKMSEKPFEEIVIPLNHDGNKIAAAILTGEPQQVTDWKYLFTPDLSPRAARFNQAGAGIECSWVYPLTAHDGGALIFSFYQDIANISPKHSAFMKAYTQLADDRLIKAKKPTP